MSDEEEETYESEEEPEEEDDFHYAEPPGDMTTGRGLFSQHGLTAGSIPLIPSPPTMTGVGLSVGSGLGLNNMMNSSNDTMMTAGLGGGINTLPVPGLQHSNVSQQQQIKEPADTLTWVSASNGHIPEGAVVGGWSSSTQEPYYIARVKSATDGALCPGVVLKSTKVCHSVFQNVPQHRRGLGAGQQGEVGVYSNYEILVNNDPNSDLSWVYISVDVDPMTIHSYQDSSSPTQTAVKFHSMSRKQDYYWVRSLSQWTGDTVPGVLMNNTFMFCENKAFRSIQLLQNYEVLCSRTTANNETDKTNSPFSAVKNRFLYDVKYDLTDSSIDWSCIKLDEIVLTNRSTVEQRNISPSFNVSCPVTFKWEIPSLESGQSMEVGIKGEIPYVFGGKDNNRIHLLDSQKLNTVVRPMDTVPGRVSSSTTLHGGRIPNINSAGMIVPLGGAYQLSQQMSKSVGIFGPTTVMVDDISKSFYCEKNSISDSTSFNVPPRSKLIIEQEGQQMNLTVPFKATLKTVYFNDSVEDEEVIGNYKHSSITASFPSVIGEKTTMY